MSSRGDPSFELPEIYHFPPFFTSKCKGEPVVVACRIQPNDSIRAKQLQQWKNLIIGWHESHGESVMTPLEWPLFENSDIHRKLSPEGIRQVMDFVVASGARDSCEGETSNGEWEDRSHVRCRIYYKSPAEWAARIYDYVSRNEMFQSIYTVYELREGDVMAGAEFFGMDATLMVKALRVLQREAKVEMYDGANLDETGVKFKSR